MEHLLLGIIFRTYLQVILNARSGGFDRSALNSLEAILMDEGPFPVTGWKRVLFRLTRRYNSLPFRIPGVNLMFFTLITGRGV